MGRRRGATRWRGPAGDGARADTLLDRAAADLQTSHATGQNVDPFQTGSLALRQAPRLHRRGQLDDARQRFEQAVDLFEQVDSPRGAAVARSGIADILYDRGAWDEALRIHREEQLPVYQRLGDVRSTAVTWGKVADVLYRRGELDEAERIRREEQLPVFERLGDVRSTAIAWGNIADVLYRRGDLDEALRIRREEQLPVYERFGDVRSTAIAWGKIADILFMRGELDEALRIRREEQLPVFERVGDVRSTAVTWGNIADILCLRGELDEARTLQERRLAVNRQESNIDGVASALWGLAQLDLAADDRQAAAPRLAEAWRLLVQLGRLDGIALVGDTFGRLLLAAANFDDAGEVLRVSSAAYGGSVERLTPIASTSCCRTTPTDSRVEASRDRRGIRHITVVGRARRGRHP